mgnify:CR=1 FL=1
MNIRWKQRFNNFENAHKNLVEMIELLKKEPSSKPFKLAVIQSYEMDIELAWNTLKDYLNYIGYTVQSPREAIKQAFAIEIFDEAETWLKMIEDRNLTSHVYDEAKAQAVVDSISEYYYNELDLLFNFLKGKLND